MSGGGIRIADWRPMRRGSLIGFAKVELPSGMVLVDCTVLTGDKGPWVSPPSKPMVGRDGAVLTDGSGRTRYAAVVEFIDKQTRDRFSAGIIDALRATYPDALPPETTS